MGGSSSPLGEEGTIKALSVFERRVTGRIVEPFANGELGEDLGERGVRGLSDSTFKPSALCDAGLFKLFLKLEDDKSRLGRVLCLEGILANICDDLYPLLRAG